jgi:hypothetical protein
MEPAAAKAFVQARKKSNGYVDRTVYATIEFEIMSLKGDDGLLAEALKVTYYRDSARRQPLGETLVWKPRSESSNEQATESASVTADPKPEGNADLSVVGRR